MISSSIIKTIASATYTAISKNQSFQEFANTFGEATVDWLKPLFLKEESSYDKKYPDEGAINKEVEKLVLEALLNSKISGDELTNIAGKLSSNSTSLLDASDINAAKKVKLKVRQKIGGESVLKNIKSVNGSVTIDISQE